MDVNLTKDYNITTGKIYQKVLNDERKGLYLGKTVQMVPHITDAIQNHIINVSKVKINCKEPEICIIELGGMVGDIESMIFLEALRQLKYKVGESNFCLIHVSLVPDVNEQKSKPTQHSVIKLRSCGLLPNMIACHSKNPITDAIKNKISRFCMINLNHFISIHTVDNIYQVPGLLKEQNVCQKILKCLGMREIESSLCEFNNIVNKSKIITIGIIGKYIIMEDSYLSLNWIKFVV